MSLGSMRQELLGIPGSNFGLATTKINEALALIQDEQAWSFQLITNGWLTPGLLSGSTGAGGAGGSSFTGYGAGGYGAGGYGGGVTTTASGGIVINSSGFLSPGLISVTPYTNIVTGDAIASQVWNGTILNPPLLTQQQFRVPYYSLYNIIALGNNGSVSYATVTSVGFGQTPGTYAVGVADGAGVGTGGVVSIVVGADGKVSTPPVVVSPGGGYVMPVINFSQGGAGVPATFQVGMQAVLTLDRPWTEPRQVNADYMIYQAYVAAPPGFKRWHVIRDTTNNAYIDWWSYSQIDLSERDAQRTNFLQPSHLVPYGMDTRQGSATYGQMLYELWPHPIMQLPYTFSCQANWPALVNPSDTVPLPLTDELVKWRSYEMLYLWKESQKGDEMERGSGANWQFLAQAANKEYQARLKTIRNMDRNLVDLYFTRMRRQASFGQVYGTVNSQANVGGWGLVMAGGIVIVGNLDDLGGGGAPSGPAGGDLTGSYPNPVVQGVANATLPVNISTPGAASTPALNLTGAPFTGGSGTTNVPLVYINGGAAPTAWPGGGTIIGVNEPSGFAGNAFELHLNGGPMVAALSGAGFWVGQRFVDPANSIGLLTGGIQLGTAARVGWTTIATYNGTIDTTLSKASAGVLQVGSGSTSNSSGTLACANVQTPLINGGAPAVQVATANFTAQSANVPNQVLYNVPVGKGGWYLVTGYVVCTQAATTSSVTPSVLVLWFDLDTGLQANTAANSTQANNVVGVNSAQGAANARALFVKEGTAINIATINYASVGATPMMFAAHCMLQYLGPA